MNKKIIWVIVVIVLILVIGAVLSSRSKTAADSEFTVGAILPMTGPAALWGETVKNGMELALAKTSGIKVLYEDSRSTAADGISAFNRLQIFGVDLTVSELSIVSVPLSKIALENKTPLLVTLVAAESSSIINDYTSRYYTDPNNYASPAFISPISPLKTAKKVAILYRNDELGVSVMNKLKELSGQNNKTIVSLESYKPAETDFSTVVLKARDSGAEAFIFVASTPGEALGILKMATQLNIGMPIIEASGVFADLNTRAQAGTVPFYSTSYDFSLPDYAEDFKIAYKSQFGKEPNFGAAFGYDIVNLIDSCKDKNDSVHTCLRGINKISGIAGTASQVLSGDFVVEMHLEKVN